MSFLSLIIMSLTILTSIGAEDAETPLMSTLLQKLHDLEERLKIQEKINKEQEIIITDLVNEKTQNCIPTDENQKQEAVNYDDGINQNNDEGNTFLASEKQGISVGNDSTSKSAIPHFTVQSRSSQMVSPRQQLSRAVQGGVAFHAYMPSSEKNPGAGQTIIFSSVVTNTGGHYNQYTGIFTSPDHGVYVFSWTIYCNSDSSFITQVVVNSSYKGSLYCYGLGASHTSITGVTIVEINQGDAVFVRTQPGGGIIGDIYSAINVQSSFSGWKLF